MDVTINGTLFSRALGTVSRAVRAHSPIPILAAVLLRCGEETGVQLLATDDEHQITRRIAGEVRAAGEIALPAKRLMEIVSGLKEQEIRLTVDGVFQATLKAGRSRYRLAGINPIHFPEFPPAESLPVLLPAALLRDMMGKCLHAVSKDASGAGTGGGRLILSDQQMLLAATDNRRLVLYTVPFEEEAGGESLAVTLPPPTMKALIHLPADPETEIIALTCDGQTIRFTWETGSIASRTLAGGFPDYRKLTQIKPDRWLSLEREPLIAALQRLQSISREDMGRVRLAVAAGTLTLTANGRDVGEGEETMAAAGPGEGTVILPNEPLLELLAEMPGPLLQMGLHAAGDRRPAWFYSEACPEYLGILMPMADSY